MDYTASFQRVEKKYLGAADQLDVFLLMLQEYMEADEYGQTAICNLYLDTSDDLLVRRSIEKPGYKEKMRLRSYGVPEDDGRVYLEIKKKAGGVVYKRRIGLSAQEAMACLTEGIPLNAEGQIAREIDYMRLRYGLYPKLYLAYDRVAYREIVPSINHVRLTIDHNIRSRDSDVDLRLGDAGRLLLGRDQYLLEVKTTGAYPLWLTAALSAAALYPTSFSKYGQVYKARVADASPLARRRSAQSRPQTSLGGFSHAFSPI